MQTLPAQLTYQKLDIKGSLHVLPAHLVAVSKSDTLMFIECPLTRNVLGKPQSVLDWRQFLQSVQLEHFDVFAQRPALLISAAPSHPGEKVSKLDTRASKQRLRSKAGTDQKAG